MADLSLANDDANGQVPNANTQDINSNGSDPAKVKGDLNVALSQERDEKATIKAEKEALATKNAELEARLKEYELSTLSDDERTDIEFTQLTVEKVLSQLDQEALKALPASIRNRIQEDPWAFMDQAELNKRTRLTETKREFYKEAEKAAVENLTEILKEYTPTGSSNEEKKDPSIRMGSQAGNDGDITSYSTAELMRMRYDEPEKFDRIRQMAKQKGI